MGYKKDTLRGVTWLGSFRIATRIISFLRTAILARLLLPSSFGLFGIVTIVLSITEILTETGINIFLIQKKDDIDEYINTAWVVSILRGLLITIIIILSSPFVAHFFKAPAVQRMLLIASLVPLIRGFINPSIVKFIKDLDFKKEFFYRTLIFFVESISSLVIVWYTDSIYGLVIGLIIGAIFEAILSFLIIRPHPKFIFIKERFFEVIHKGKWMTASGIFNYLYHNLDTVIVGRLFDTTALGLYDMTYKISSLPISEFADVINRSTFPVYVKIAEDKKRLFNAFIKTIIITTLLVLPVVIAFFFFPREIIEVVLGHQWLTAAPVLKILALYGALRALSNVTNGLFYSVNRQDYVTKVTFLSLLGMVISIFPLMNAYGLIGAGIAALIGTLVPYPLIMYYISKIIRSNPIS